MSISHLVEGLITSAGYPAVFALVGAESLGIPLPGETALVLASIYAGTTHRLSPWLIFAAAAGGAIIGDNIGFWIGVTGGYRLARRHGPKVRLDERKLKVARYLFDRHGAKLVFSGRFVSVLRTYAAFLAGTTRMRWPRFLVANAAGGIVWAAIYTAAGSSPRSAAAPVRDDRPCARRHRRTGDRPRDGAAAAAAGRAERARRTGVPGPLG